MVALGVGRWIAPLVFKQSPRDPAAFALVTAVLIPVAIVVGCVPPVRAAGLDPNTA